MNEEVVTKAEEQAERTVDVVNIERVMELIPHRYPMLMIDRVIDLVVGESATGVKNVSINEPQFQGHFPNHPIMPGVLIIEAMAQTSAVLVVETLGKEFEGKLVYFMGIDRARFRKPVTPGDVMMVHVEKEQRRSAVWKFRSVVKVDGKTVADANYSAMIMDH
ncbi:MAG: 3-hydroxyacyl-ACP dehydratase FabZ [Alphaproteobacteria bacterium]|jgi:3-hydroxyacyl-[acyl-carrier-protein] dehydratase|nr:3-hydroxyacyl-ACP dehydratase FabZ [Rhodospirillaceae bacterium]MBT6511097.1 3-hydroxyacyl-ACP dehydratase FabZ [Rhodospirillaceae bacterium]MBT7647159.1 3-hydroxyacyl-ACP dehydratase FabZ [Rhodospirillaceae bacterium]MDG2481117.1 3-hydroxyacyl-ACP dehydratase FabZ [Alphaproteobacteria bacterium]